MISPRKAAWPRLSVRTGSRLAWSLFAVFLGMVVATIGLVASGSGTSDEAFVVLWLAFAVVGALIASREPGNAVGWLLLATSIFSAMGSFADAYVARAGHPGEVAVAWFASWAHYIWLYLAALVLPLVFPGGRLPSPRWKIVLGMALGALVLAVLVGGLTAGTLEVDSPEPIRNPIGIGGPVGRVIDAAGTLRDVLAATGFVLGGVSLVLRLRRSTGRERLQLKLFAYVGALALAGLALSMVEVLTPSGGPRWVSVLGAVGWLSAVLLIILGLPLAVGVAILRHQLYDIDVVINRTLVYGALTATLVTAYLASILVFRLVLSPLTGQSDLAVAGSTLAVAALVRPARSRIQRLVDRRFYRARYDAARTLEDFSARLRDELDLEALGADMRRIVHDTMAPSHVSLWLRGSL